MTNTRVLIVEDEFFIADMLTMMAEDMGLEVCALAATAEEAESLARQHAPDLVFMDVRLKGERDGVDAAHAIHAMLPAPIIYITGSRERATIDRINADHPACIVFKPFQFEQLRGAVQQVLG
ncbi:MAG: response regulator [Acetobacteraceae bacterium]